MAATLVPGVRKLPAANEMAVVSALWSGDYTPSSQPINGSDPAAVVQAAVLPALPPVHVAPVPTAMIVDHAIAALAPSATAFGPVPSTDSQSDQRAGRAATNYREGHRVIVESKAHGADHGRRKLAQQAGSSAHSKDHQETLSSPPDGSLAIQFSHSASKNHRATDKKAGYVPSPRL